MTTPNITKEEQPECLWYRTSHVEAEKHRYTITKFDEVGCMDCSGNNIWCNYYMEKKNDE